MKHALAALAVLGLLSPTVAGCATTTERDDMSSQIEQAPVRTDLAPLTSRFSALGPLTDAHWVGGRLGDDRLPGPSTYFIEAVVHLADPSRTTRDDTQPAPAPQAPSSLRTLISSDAGWNYSHRLDTDTAPRDWAATVYLRPGTDLAYISARGE